MCTTWSAGKWETGWEREKLDVRMMQYAVFTVLSVCFAWSLPYSVYAVLGVNSWSGELEIESDDWTSCFQVMVEIRRSKRELSGHGSNHWEKLELKRSSCPSQFTILDTAGTTPNQECNYTDRMSSKSNRASCTPNFRYLVISSQWFSSSSPIFLFLVHNSIIISEPKVKSSLSILLGHDH